MPFIEVADAPSDMENRRLLYEMGVDALGMEAGMNLMPTNLLPDAAETARAMNGIGLGDGQDTPASIASALTNLAIPTIQAFQKYHPPPVAPKPIVIQQESGTSNWVWGLAIVGVALAVFSGAVIYKSRSRSVKKNPAYKKMKRKMKKVKRRYRALRNNIYRGRYRK